MPCEAIALRKQQYFKEKHVKRNFHTQSTVLKTKQHFEGTRAVKQINTVSEWSKEIKEHLL